MSRVVLFPLPTNSPETSESVSLAENGEDQPVTSLPSLDEIESGRQAGVDPSEWGVPRAFFVVQAPLERIVDANTAC